MSTDIDLIQSCLSSNDSTTCVGQCQWRHGKNHTTGQEPVPLFSTDFCHPVSVNGNTTSTEWDSCMNLYSSSACSMEQGCNWSTGKELIPDHPFCAPADLTNDFNLVQGCVAVQNATDCVTPCQWRQGLNANGTANHTGPHYGTGFCKWVSGVTAGAYDPCMTMTSDWECSNNTMCAW